VRNIPNFQKSGTKTKKNHVGGRFVDFKKSKKHACFIFSYVPGPIYFAGTFGRRMCHFGNRKMSASTGTGTPARAPALHSCFFFPPFFWLIPYFMIPKTHKSNPVSILKDPFLHFDTPSPFHSRSYLMIPKIPKFKQVRILNNPFHHFDTIFANFEYKY
jgi:hypothetical protein